MKLFPTILIAAFLLGGALSVANAVGSQLSLAAVLQGKQVVAEARGNGHDQLSLTLRNSSANPVAVTIPAGLIAESHDKADRVIVLRKADASIPAGSAVEVSLPVAALSSKNTTSTQPYALTDASEPKLGPLLDYLAGQPDAPRTTAQLAIFCLLENMNYGQWLQTLAAAPAPANSAQPAPASTTHPTPADITEAVDVLGLLRHLAPQQTFAIASDSELKLRALRNPWCRVKAMQVYGLSLGDGAVPPDLGQLLHTKAGDNCPICRQRALMEKAAAGAL
ncbi:MAG TPA: hypothetical protein VGM54_12035 [Chthoniobacter sp.]